MLFTKASCSAIHRRRRYFALLEIDVAISISCSSGAGAPMLEDEEERTSPLTEPVPLIPVVSVDGRVVEVGAGNDGIVTSDGVVFTILM